MNSPDDWVEMKGFTIEWLSSFDNYVNSPDDRVGMKGFTIELLTNFEKVVYFKVV